jgi:uncharacterized protein (DUF2062 family)
LRELAARALGERCTPRGIGLSVGAGAFAGCTPWGFHAAVALALATVLRLNRLWAFLASRVSILPVYLAFAISEIEVGHRLRTGQFTHQTPSEAFAHRYELMTDWAIGTLLVGGAVAVLSGLVAYACARAWQKRRGGRQDAVGSAAGPQDVTGSTAGPQDAVGSAAATLRTRDEFRPPSSGSPTSAPPDPTP